MPIWAPIQCLFVTLNEPADPNSLLPSNFSSSASAPSPCQHHSAGDGPPHGSRLPSGPVPCPARYTFLSLDLLLWRTELPFYVPSLAGQNNSAILAYVARHARWKLNCFLQKQLCDDQLPNQDPFYGSPRGRRGTRLCLLCRY